MLSANIKIGVKEEGVGGGGGGYGWGEDGDGRRLGLWGWTHNSVQWCVIELCTWHLDNFVNQCHPINSIKRKKGGSRPSNLPSNQVNVIREASDSTQSQRHLRPLKGPEIMKQTPLKGNLLIKMKSCFSNVLTCTFVWGCSAVWEGPDQASSCFPVTKSPACPYQNVGSSNDGLTGMNAWKPQVKNTFPLNVAIISYFPILRPYEYRPYRKYAAI